MAVADEEKAAWTAAVENVAAIPDENARDAQGLAFYRKLSEIPAADRWTDSRSAFWGFRSGWKTWQELLAMCQEARKPASVGASVANLPPMPKPVVTIPTPGGSIALGQPEVNDALAAGVKAATDNPVGKTLKDIGTGVSDAAHSFAEIGWALPLLLVGVVLLAVYRRAR